MGFGLVGFYGISTIQGRLFNGISTNQCQIVYTYISYIGFGLVGFYISTIQI